MFSFGNFPFSSSYSGGSRFVIFPVGIFWLPINRSCIPDFYPLDFVSKALVHWREEDRGKESKQRRVSQIANDLGEWKDLWVSCTSEIYSLCPVVFLAFSIHLSFVGLWVGWSQNLSFLCRKSGEAVTCLVLLLLFFFLFFFSQEGKFILVGEFPLGPEQCWLGEWVDAARMKLFFLPFGCSYCQILLCWNFLSGLQNLPEPFCPWIAV